MKLLKLNEYSGTKILSTKLINSEMIMCVQRNGNIVKIKYSKGPSNGASNSHEYNVSFVDANEAEKYFDYVMEKLRAIKLEEKPW